MDLLKAVERKQWLDGIKNKLLAENIKNLSDDEITRCLKNCVLAHKLIPLALEYRNRGLLNVD